MFLGLIWPYLVVLVDGSGSILVRKDWMVLCTRDRLLSGSNGSCGRRGLSMARKVRLVIMLRLSG